MSMEQTPRMPTERHQTKAKWLESVARDKAAVEGDTDATKTLETMIKNLHEKPMHCKLSYITKGA